MCSGDRLGLEDAYESGDGTYVRSGAIYSSVVGRTRILSDTEGKVGGN